MSGDRDDWDKYLTPHYTYVVKNLQLSPVLDELKQKGLINREEYKRQRKLIKNECDEDGTRNLLTEILPKKGPTSFKEFLEVLKKTDQQHIADRLLPKVMELQGPSFRENMQRGQNCAIACHSSLCVVWLCPCIHLHVQYTYIHNTYIYYFVHPSIHTYTHTYIHTYIFFYIDYKNL